MGSLCEDFGVGRARNLATIGCFGVKQLDFVTLQYHKWPLSISPFASLPQLHPSTCFLGSHLCLCRKNVQNIPIRDAMMMPDGWRSCMCVCVHVMCTWKTLCVCKCDCVCALGALLNRSVRSPAHWILRIFQEFAERQEPFHDNITRVNSNHPHRWASPSNKIFACLYACTMRV